MQDKFILESLPTSSYSCGVEETRLKELLNRMDKAGYEFKGQVSCYKQSSGGSMSGDEVLIFQRSDGGK